MLESLAIIMEEQREMRDRPGRIPSRRSREADPNIDSDRVLESIKEYLNTDNEDTALWYPLIEDDLEPPDPC